MGVHACVAGARDVEGGWMRCRCVGVGVGVVQARGLVKLHVLHTMSECC